MKNIGMAFASMAAIEALEHNAIQSKEWMRLGEDIKRSHPKLYKELTSDYAYPHLVHAIDEPLAYFGFSDGSIKSRQITI